jgi:hypothetical protein
VESGTQRRARRAGAPRAWVAALALLTACMGVGLPHSGAPGRAALAPTPLPPLAARIRIVGDRELAALTRNALDRVFTTRVGARLRERVESGTLPGPLVIELNLRGEDFTVYRVPGSELAETISFDVWTLPEVDTEVGRRRATRETVLAHELGHAVLKLRSEELVIREVENPVRDELGLPRRVRF